MEEKDRLRLEYRRYMTGCGLPSRYFSDDMTLRKFGPVGDYWADVMSNADLRKEVFSNFFVLNFYGNDSITSDLFYAMLRAMLIQRRDGRIVYAMNFPYAGTDDSDTLMDLDFIGIPNFYSSHYADCPFDLKQQFSMETFLSQFINQQGRILILQTDSPLSEIKWYPPNFVKLLSTYGKDVCCDSRA